MMEMRLDEPYGKLMYDWKSGSKDHVVDFDLTIYIYLYIFDESYGKFMDDWKTGSKDNYMIPHDNPTC